MEMGEDGVTEVFLSSSPPKEAPPPLPLGVHDLPPEVFGPSETDEESPTKPPPLTCQPRTSWSRRGPPPPVPPRASSGHQAKLLGFKKMKVLSDHSQSDVRSLLGKHTGHLEELLTRQNISSIESI